MTTPTKLASIPVLFNTDETTGTANTITGAALALSLPNVDGQVLSSTTRGTTSWVTVSSGSSLVFSGNGIGANTAAVLTWTYNGVASTGGDTNFTFTFAGTNKLPTSISFIQTNGQTDGWANFITQLSGNATIISNWTRATPSSFTVTLTELVPAGIVNVTCTMTQTGGTGPAFTYVFTPGISTTIPTRVNIGNNLLGAVTGTVLDLSATGSASVPTLQQVTTAGAQTSVNTFFGAATGNSIGLSGNVNNSAPVLAAVAATSGTPDANVNLFINTVGRGTLNLCAQQANYLSVSSAATGNPFISVAGNATSMNLLHSASGQVNIGPAAGGFVAIQGSNTGPASIAATNANQGIGLVPTGTGATVLGNTQTATGFTIAGGNTTYVALNATGSNALIDLVLTPKGSGSLYPIGGTLSATLTNQPRIFLATQLGSTTLGPGAGLQAIRSNGNGAAPFWSAVGGTWYGRVPAYSVGPPVTGQIIGSADTLLNATVVSSSLPSYVSFSGGLLTNNSSMTITVMVSISLALTNTGSTAPTEVDVWIRDSNAVRYAQAEYPASTWAGAAGAWNFLRNISCTVPLAANTSIGCYAFSSGAADSRTGAIFGGFTTATIFTVF